MERADHDAGQSVITDIQQNSAGLFEGGQIFAKDGLVLAAARRL
jgi:hypothetical protein